jgi:hypothetical protein
MGNCAVCPFRAHRDFFGKPNTGVHRYRIFDAAAVDYFLTLLVAMATTYTTGIPLVLSTICWFTLGLLLHVLFGVNTAAVRWLGLACN